MKVLSTGILSIINMKSQNFFNISQLVQNGKIVQNPKDIAAILNQYFVIISSKLMLEFLEQENSHWTIWVETLAPHFSHSYQLS